MKHALILQIGLRKNIYLELKDENPDASLPILDTVRANTTFSYDLIEASAASNFSDIDNTGSVSAIPFETSAAQPGGWDIPVELPDITPPNSSSVEQS